jgi:hypothetical protein
MTSRKKQASALDGTVGIEDQASEERIAEIASGRSHEQQRLAATCKDSSNEVLQTKGGESSMGLANESIGARTGE